MKQWMRRSLFFATVISAGMLGCDIEDPIGGGAGGEGGVVGAGGAGEGGSGEGGSGEGGAGEGGAGGAGAAGGAGGAGAAGGEGGAGAGGAGAAGGGEGGAGGNAQCRTPRDCPPSDDPNCRPTCDAGMCGEECRPPECSDASPCPEGQLCEEGQCIDDGGCDCPDVYMPVCGANGQTYGNACEARCAGVPVASEGECAQGCQSNDECEAGEGCEAACVDGVCEQRCGGCQSDDECAEGETCVDERCVPDDDCLCPQVYEPVCGADGQTYGNACLARCAGIEFRPGECRVDCEPVACDLACEHGFRVGEDGCEICECADPPGCRENADCPQPGAPNCAGVCVRGQCQVECEEPERCENDRDCPEGTVCDDGRCVRRDDCICPDVVQPVCGADGNTYNNACEARCAGVEIIGEGECRGQECERPGDCPPGFRCDAGGCLPIRCRADDDCPEGLACEDGFCQQPGPQCPDPNDPNVSYISDDPAECARIAFRCEPGHVAFNDDCGCGCIRVDEPVQCRADDDCPRGQACIDGRCQEEPCACPENWDPVCGVNGQTYGNACFARCDRVEIAYEGECRNECPDPRDPRVDYVSEDPRECALIDFACAPGQEMFSNECGCGCIGEPEPNRCRDDAECQRGERCIDGVCQPFEPCECPEIYAPVCGIDGRTYDNACFARCAGVEVAHDGECRNECPDPEDPRVHYVSQDPDRCAVIRFVCEEGQEPFSNECGCGCIGDPRPPVCEADDDCPRGQICREGECVDDEICVCPDVWDPVCGADGRTYGNACEARCARVEVAYEGECRNECPDPDDPRVNYVSQDPAECAVIRFVCEEGQEAFSNECGCGCIGEPAPPACEGNADCPRGQVCENRQCVNIEECVCPRIYDPVCGVDGRTYGNACEARCAQVEIAYEGECRDNRCEADDQCERGQICRDGECVDDEICVCPDVWDPVCGADGRTYGNACEARCARVEVAYEGECRPDRCENNDDCPAGFRCDAGGCLPIRCQADADCGDGLVCEGGQCVAGPMCPDPRDPRVNYVSQDPEECARIRFVCEAGQEAFSNACGCGCIGEPAPECSADRPCPRGQICEAGQCVEEGGGCICPQVFDPVCGSDGNTYNNACEARCAGVEWRAGPCREPVECGRGEIPVNGQCEQACRGDQDCERGQSCNAAEVCLPDPECPVCDVCAGWCVDAAAPRE